MTFRSQRLTAAALLILGVAGLVLLIGWDAQRASNDDDIPLNPLLNDIRFLLVLITGVSSIWIIELQTVKINYHLFNRRLDALANQHVEQNIALDDITRDITRDLMPGTARARISMPHLVPISGVYGVHDEVTERATAQPRRTRRRGTRRTRPGTRAKQTVGPPGPIDTDMSTYVDGELRAYFTGLAEAERRRDPDEDL